MELLVAQAVNGCALGSLYALFGIGFGLMFAAAGVLNAAQGCYASLGAIAAVVAAEVFELPFAASLACGVAVAVAIAVAVDLLAFQPLRRRNAGPVATLVASVAVWLVLDSLAGLVTGEQSLAFPPDSWPDGVLSLGFVQVPAMQLIAIAGLLVVTLGLQRLVRRTGLGAAMRAVGCDPAAAALSGVNARNVGMAVAALSGGVAGLAGVLGGVMTANVGAGLGQGLLLKGFAAVAIGGPANLPAVALAGVVLGVLEVYGTPYLSAGLRDGITCALLLGFLLLRPRGMPGRVGR
jgi:branched-chain amino acid transport system permease protein